MVIILIGSGIALRVDFSSQDSCDVSGYAIYETKDPNDHPNERGGVGEKPDRTFALCSPRSGEQMLHQYQS